mgnify:CR=1 FL=1|jgi:hypothetical protein
MLTNEEAIEEALFMIEFSKDTMFYIRCGLSQNNHTGYEIFPVCSIYYHKDIPENVVKTLEGLGLPIRHRYKEPQHITKLLRLFKPFEKYTKNPEGYADVKKWNGAIPPHKTHADIRLILEMLENESI